MFCTGHAHELFIHARVLEPSGAFRSQSEDSQQEIPSYIVLEAMAGQQETFSNAVMDILSEIGVENQKARNARVPEILRIDLETEDNNILTRTRRTGQRPLREITRVPQSEPTSEESEEEPEMTHRPIALMAKASSFTQKISKGPVFHRLGWSWWPKNWNNSEGQVPWCNTWEEHLQATILYNAEARRDGAKWNEALKVSFQAWSYWLGKPERPRHQQKKECMKKSSRSTGEVNKS